MGRYGFAYSTLQHQHRLFMSTYLTVAADPAACLW